MYDGTLFRRLLYIATEQRSVVLNKTSDAPPF